MDEGEAGMWASESPWTSLVGTAMLVAGSHLALGQSMGKPLATDGQAGRYLMLKAFGSDRTQERWQVITYGVERLFAKPRYKPQGSTT